MTFYWDPKEQSIIFDRDPNVKINMAAKIQDGGQNGCRMFLTSENQLFQWFLIF